MTELFSTDFPILPLIQLFVGIGVILYFLHPSFYNKSAYLRERKWLRIIFGIMGVFIIVGSIFNILIRIPLAPSNAMNIDTARPCEAGRVPLKQADGTWVCVEDTSACPCEIVRSFYPTSAEWTDWAPPECMLDEQSLILRGPMYEGTLKYNKLLLGPFIVESKDIGPVCMIWGDTNSDFMVIENQQEWDDCIVDVRTVASALGGKLS